VNNTHPPAFHTSKFVILFSVEELGLIGSKYR